MQQTEVVVVVGAKVRNRDERAPVAVRTINHLSGISGVSVGATVCIRTRKGYCYIAGLFLVIQVSSLVFLSSDRDCLYRLWVWSV